jgi:hypothetical protein
MWDSQLAARARAYPTGVLSWVGPSGYPVSVRVAAELHEASESVSFPELPPAALDAAVLACLLFHFHDDRLEGLRQMVIKGELVAGKGSVVLKVTEFVTANGRTHTDQMPHAGAPLHMLAFYRLGRRKAREYLARRAEPWPPIPFKEISRAVVAEGEPQGAGPGARPASR